MKIAIIGYGGMAEEHVRRFAKYNTDAPKELNIEVLGVYDIDPARNRVAREHGLYIYESAAVLFADKNVDAVLIATPNDFHHPYALEAAKAKKHILCEKPVALSSAETEEMFAAAEKAGVVLYVHQNRRYDLDYLTVKAMKDSSALGGVYRIDSRVTGANGIPGAWRRNKSQGGGMLLDWGVHQIDQILQMFDEPVTSVYCRMTDLFGAGVDDGYRLVLNFKSGLSVYIETETNTFIHQPRWTVFGHDGTAEIRDWDLSGEIVTVKEREDEDLKAVVAGNGLTKTMARRSEKTMRTLPLPKVESQPYALYRNFVLSAAGKETQFVKKDEVLRNFYVIEAAFKSAETGEAVKTNL